MTGGGCPGWTPSAHLHAFSETGGVRGTPAPTSDLTASETTNTATPVMGPELGVGI